MISFKQHSNYYVLKINSVPIRIDFKGNILDKEKLKNLHMAEVTITDSKDQRVLKITNHFYGSMTFSLELKISF